MPYIRAHAACTRVSDTTLFGAVGNHTKVESSARGHCVSRCNICSRDLAHSLPFAKKVFDKVQRHTGTTALKRCEHAMVWDLSLLHETRIVEDDRGPTQVIEPVGKKQKACDVNKELADDVAEKAVL